METNGHRQLTQPEIDALWHNQTTNNRGIGLCRQALADARTRCCSHGVPRSNCRQHDNEEVP